MLSNYLKIAIRYLVKYKEYTAINILGLAVGITCCLLIMLFVRSEFSYDNFHSKSHRIYRAWQHEKYEGQDFINTVTPLPMAGALQSSFAEIEATCRVYAFNPMIRIDANSFSQDARMVDSTFFKIFDFELLEGDRNKPFPTVNSVIITPEISKKYFGGQKAVGRNIEIQLGDEKILFTVSGIAKKSPEASSIKYKVLIPYSNAKHLFRPGLFTNWFNVFTETFVLLKEKVKLAELERKFPTMIRQQLGEEYKEGGFIVRLQPLTNIHLNTSLPTGNEPTSNPKYSYILGTIGVLILLVACINFITLSIGRSTTRAMEVGVRKVMGAERNQLIRQFWGEAFLLTLVSVMAGLLLSYVLINPFNKLINRNLYIEFDAVFIFFCILLIALIALIAGVYPAIVLAGFKPVEALKGKLKMQGSKNWLRQGLITGQFIASIAMIVCTIVIGEQMKFLRNKDLGYQKDQVVIVPTNMSRKDGLAFAENYRTQLLKHPQIENAGISLFSFAETPWVELGFTNDKKVYKGFQYNAVDPNFITMMNIEVIEGRNFFPQNTADNNTAALVNEAFVKEFGLTSPVGKKLPGKFDQYIIGVVKDFHFESLHTKIRPLLLTVKPDSVFRRTENIGISHPPQPRVSVRFKAGVMAENIALLKNTWKKIAPSQEFEYRFLDETIAAQYLQEERTSTIIKLASALSIFIACMGLFGLATLTVVRRTKEIGIRKVLGATVTSIVGLISKDFVKLVIVASVIAYPVAWWAMNNWLEDFPYRVSVSWWAYLLAGIIALAIALLTVSFQAIKAALSNPVKSLRSE
ncbi:MAG TPA: ABC transporter permease [Flavitalea sp.]|nr:ABC transporter permease [Flavitalea sp.]